MDILIDALFVVFMVTFTPIVVDGTPSDKGKDAKILILGAGMSGITAASTLQEAGYKNIQLLEAQDKLGGRIRTEYIDGTAVEAGALWVYGKGTNPIYRKAVEYGMSVADSIVDNWVLRDEFGNDVTDEGDEAYDRLMESLDGISKLAAQKRATRESDFSIRAGLRHVGWRPITPTEDAVEAYFVDFETGFQAEGQSGKYLYFQEISEDIGDDTLMIIDDPRGFSYMVEKMAEPLIAANSQTILFNKTVTVIEHSDTGVKVITSNGEVFQADFAILTFSLGVLQHRLVTFSPPLPPNKQLAIDKHGIAEFTHIYIKYPTAFWDNATYLVFASMLRSKFTCWQNMNSVAPGSNILQITLFNEFARWADQATDLEILDEATESLAAMYPNISIPGYTSYKISRWNRDLSFMGSFSYWPASFTADDMELVQRPIGRLYFAGEHTHPIHYGFAHGAYLTGEATAQSLIKCNNETEFVYMYFGSKRYCPGMDTISAASSPVREDGLIMHLLLSLLVVLVSGRWAEL